MMSLSTLNILLIISILLMCWCLTMSLTKWKISAMLFIFSGEVWYRVGWSVKCSSTRIHSASKSVETSFNATISLGEAMRNSPVFTSRVSSLLLLKCSRHLPCFSNSSLVKSVRSFTISASSSELTQLFSPPLMAKWAA